MSLGGATASIYTSFNLQARPDRAGLPFPPDTLGHFHSTFSVCVFTWLLFLMGPRWVRRQASWLFDMWASSQPVPGHCTTPFLLIHPLLSLPLLMKVVHDPAFLSQIQHFQAFSLLFFFSITLHQFSLSKCKAFPYLYNKIPLRSGWRWQSWSVMDRIY